MNLMFLYSTALSLLLLTACGGETGIIIAVAGPSVEELEFQVGIAQGEEVVLDSSASGTRREVRGRNLKASPYELLLLLEEGQESQPLTVRALVLGYNNDKLQYLGFTEPPQAFLQEKVLRRSLLLEQVGPNASVTAHGKGCFRVRLKDQRWNLLAANDRDCDGYATTDDPPDCDDQNPALNPGVQGSCN